MSFSPIKLTFQGDTLELLRRPPDEGQTVVYTSHRKASIKDIIEGLGVPHTEVGVIVLDGRQQTFNTIPSAGEHFHIHPLSSAASPLEPTLLRPEPLPGFTFMVDINVNRLAPLLRMAGFDARSAAAVDNAEVIRETVSEKRILLSRNRDLLKHRTVSHGRLVRSQDPYMQLDEIINLYHLHPLARPFTRCMHCNTLLRHVAKETIINELLPLTKKYYSHFKRCPRCHKIFWRGSHHDHMVK
ncbi:MAG: Mut7-C RNAse domain-containing protein, partial [Desulforhopalus sp.]